MRIDDDVGDDESSFNGNDVSVSSVPIVPLFLPQPVQPFPPNNGSIHSAGSATDADVSSDDDDSATLAPADIPAPINDATAGVLLDHIAPDEYIFVAANASACKVIPPDAPDDISFDDVAVSFDDVADASPNEPHDAPDPVDFDMLADDDAVEVTIDEPTNTYNLRSRSAPTFGSYSNPNNVQLHQ